MSCKYCTPVLEDNGEIHELVGEWAFTTDDDLLHKASGRVSLWYDFEDGWSMILLVDDGATINSSLPATAMLKPRVCPFCGRELKDGNPWA